MLEDFWNNLDLDTSEIPKAEGLLFYCYSFSVQCGMNTLDTGAVVSAQDLVDPAHVHYQGMGTCRHTDFICLNILLVGGEG